MMSIVVVETIMVVLMLTMVMVVIELTGDCDEVILPIQSSTGDYNGRSDKNCDIFIMAMMIIFTVNR